MIARFVRLIAVMLALLATPAFAQADLAGTWAVEAEEHPIMLLTLAKEGAGWHARMRALHWDEGTTQAAHLHGPATDEALHVVAATPAAIGLAFPDGTGFDLHPLSRDVAEWRSRVDAGSASTGGDSGAVFVFRRVPVGTSLATGLDPARTYAIDAPYPDEPAMTRLFDADQRDRQGAHIDWRVVAPADARRRAETQALLDAGALHSGTDYWHAAFVFQHGGAPADYLKAHALAVIAASRGRRDAAWIAAATFDRYLQAIGQKQVYGTQYQMRNDAPTTQEPYDRTVLSDALRRATGVPTQAEQEVRRAGYDKQRGLLPPRPTRAARPPIAG